MVKGFTREWITGEMTTVNFKLQEVCSAEIGDIKVQTHLRLGELLETWWKSNGVLGRI